MILVTTTTKITLSLVLTSVPAAAITYYFLPDTVKNKIHNSSFVKSLNKKYVYFLVSKTNANKGAFYNADKVQAKSSGTAVFSLFSTGTNYINKYKKNLQEWEEDAEKLNKSKVTHLYPNDKKSYKCSIPIVDKQLKQHQKSVWDRDCSIYSIKNTVKKTSELTAGEDHSLNFDVLNKIKRKSEVSYNQMYLLSVNARIIEDFNFALDLIIDVVEHDANEVLDSNRIFSFDINNQYLAFKNFWVGKVNKTFVESKSKLNKNSSSTSYKKFCQADYSKAEECLVFNFDTSDNEYNQYEKLKEVESNTLSDSKKYMVYFLTTRFNNPSSNRLKRDYKYLQDRNNKNEELITFEYKSAILGFINIEEPEKTQLFSLDNAEEAKSP